MADNLLIPNIGPIQPKTEIGERQPADKSKGPAFDSVLKGKLSEQANPLAPEINSAPLKFSAHALNRLHERSIPMGGEMLAKLEKAVDTAAQKGAKESLILTNDAAFIVSVKNKTVITVVDRNQMSGNVFTNIDSTVVI
jgi:flagellar operon protein